MPYTCSRCARSHCPNCRLPESHNCTASGVVPSQRNEVGRRSSIKTIGLVGASFLGAAGGVFAFTSFEPDDVGLSLERRGGGVRGAGGNETATATPTPEPTIVGPDLSTVVDSFHQRLNEHRADSGRLRLRHWDRLASAAQEHAEAMAEQGFFDHVNPSGETVLQRYNHLCQYPGENIAYTYWNELVENAWGGETYIDDEVHLANHIFEMWLTSPGHLENMEHENFGRHGIGFAFDEDTNRVYAVNAFCE